MSPDHEIAFTSEQLDLIDRPGSQYVDACPGAGKTQALAERYVRRPNSHPRKGVALLSFTNAATDEARRRCVVNPELLLAPNFIGTIDQFINRFIVTPARVVQRSAPTRFVNTWSQLPQTTVKCKKVAGTASLDWFEFDQNGTAALAVRRAPAGARQSLGKLEPWAKAMLEERATELYKQLLARGYHDASASRRIALTYLDDDRIGNDLSVLIGSRFAEIIVDEVQDCSDEDVVILEWLNKSGAYLVLVGDPDQSIFEFRGRSDDANDRLKSLLPAGTRLSGNFRSTPAICQLATSLRASSSAVDEARGKHRSNSQPVLLYKYSKPRNVATVGSEIAAENGFSSDECVVLAHGTRQAAQCAGGSVHDASVGARIPRIVLAIESLQASSSTPKQRRGALDDLAVCLHESAHNEFKDLPLFDFYDAIGTSPREHTALLLRLALAVNVNRKETAAVFKNDLVEKANALGMTWIRPGALLLPKEATWKRMPSTKKPLLEHGSIHSYKGLQREFVVVVIPDGGARPDSDTGVGQWRSGVSGEARRVLYVGATRAAQVLLLAVHESAYAKVADQLARDNIPVQLVGG